MHALRNIWLLGVKEVRSLLADTFLMLFVVYAFSFSIYSAANGVSSDVHNAAVAVVDEDRSVLSDRIVNALQPPEFKTPEYVSADVIDVSLDEARYGFALVIPAGFEEDVIAGRHPEIQLNIDATLIMQAQVGAGYIQNIIANELTRFVNRSDEEAALPVRLTTRFIFNPNADSSWFTSITILIQMVTTLSMFLTGAALIREREHGTIEHLLVLPVTPFEIATAKVWANSAVILVAATLSLVFIVRGVVGVPIAGSVGLFIFGSALYLFFTSALGVFLGTITKSMPQFALATILFMLPMTMLSGSSTPVESQPELLQTLTLALPTRHYVSYAQAILFRGAGLDIVWPSFLVVFLMGVGFLAYSIARFRNAIAG